MSQFKKTTIEFNSVWLINNLKLSVMSEAKFKVRER